MTRMLAATALAAALVAALPAAHAARLATTPNDYLQPGTQPSPSELNDFIPAASLCVTCHGGFDSTGRPPDDAWVASMMAQAARDPVTRAAAAIANQDAASSGETCIRCHAPIGWLGGRSSGGDFANLGPGDLDGVTCDVCHRMLDPIARADAPSADAAILSALDQTGVRPGGHCVGTQQACTADADCGAVACNLDAGQGRYVVSPDDSRRGPRSLQFHIHDTTASPFHASAEACASCHDVSTPTFTRQSDGSYALNALDAPHPTQNPDDMFPEQRTYSEWRASTFAGDGVVFSDGRFGGKKTATLPNVVPVSTCQDCHMPQALEAACAQGQPRPDHPVHYFAGANSWVPSAVLAQYGADSGLTADVVAAAHDRVTAMLQKAADLTANQTCDTLAVRVTNQTGHKLPTGYPEGRRMWLAVRWLAGDAATPVAEDGAYDADTATLDVAHTTKIYEVQQVVGAAVASAAGIADATPFHLVLSSRIAADDRIPPRGFTNAAFAAFGGAPVGVDYPDGQNWDDTGYDVPLAATRAEVTLYHQTTTREYAEFLRDTTPDGTGPNAYDRWTAAGRSAPVTMAQVTVDLTTGFDALGCLLDRLAAPTVCADPLPHRLRHTVDAGTRTARRLAATAQKKLGKAPARRIGKLLDGAAHALDGVRTRAAKAVDARKAAQRIPATCRDALGAIVARAQGVLDQARPAAAR